MKKLSKTDELLTACNFSDKEKDAFKKCLNIIRQGQNDPSIDAEDEMKSIIREIANEI